MKLTKYFLTFLIAFSFLQNIRGQDNIYFNFDYCIFRGEENKYILEVYYSVNQKSLIYIKQNNNFEASAKIHIELTDLNSGSVISDKLYRSPTVVSDTSDKRLNQKIVGQINYLIGEGKYKLKITGSDFNDSSKTDVLEQDFSVTDNDNSKIKVSDIELATNIQKSQNDKSTFYKNTLEVIPNPSNLFGMNLAEMFFYYEIYGLTESNISDNYYICYSVTNLNNETLISYCKNAKRTGESKADYGKVKIDSLDRGSYFLKITVADSLRQISFSSEKKFYIFNSGKIIAPLNPQDEYLKSEYAIMKEEELDKEYNYAQYIMTEKDKRRYDDYKLVDAKRKFMYEFWKSKDDNPNTPSNEYKINYFKRVKEANNNFKEAYKEGWKTDRGRIYLVYGKPDDVEKFPFEANKKSYEIWKYDTVEGGGECVFIEKQSLTGVYWLAHSTFRGELRNEDWESDLNQ